MHQIFQQSILLRYGVCLLFFWSGDMNISESCRQPQSRLYTVEIPYMISNSFLRYCLQGVVISLAFFIFSTFFLPYFLVSCSHLFLSFYRSQSLLSSNFVAFPAVCISSATVILLPRLTHVRNKLFQVLALFCMVINYRRRMRSSVNNRGKIGEN
jgi:hypothetical protein